MELWNKDIEEKFFGETLIVTSPEKLFYRTKDNRHVAYWPKEYKGEKGTIQSRNTYIGKYTENWTKEVIKSCIEAKGLFAILDAECEEIALSNRSPADIVISQKNSKTLDPEDICVILEVKMSIVWNWEYKDKRLICMGDYKTHQGTPGMLRSDSMLKAIGKSVNIRTSNVKSASIPIMVVYNILCKY